MPGPAREGLCLLQGVLVCADLRAQGERARYTGNGGVYPMYECISRRRDGLESSCNLHLPARPIDRGLRRAAGRGHHAAEDRTRSGRTDHSGGARSCDQRAMANADRTGTIRSRPRRAALRRRRSQQPADRRDTRAALERGSCSACAILKRSWPPSNSRSCAPSPPSRNEQILQLVTDFPRLWGAPTTTSKDRKRILRLLVRDITVIKGPGRRSVNLHDTLARRRNGDHNGRLAAEPGRRCSLSGRVRRSHSHIRSSIITTKKSPPS